MNPATQYKKPYYDYIIHLKQYIMKSPRRCVSLFSSTEIKKQRPHATVCCSANQLITLQIWGKKAAELKVQFAAARMGQTMFISLFSTAVCHTSTRCFASQCEQEHDSEFLHSHTNTVDVFLCILSKKMGCIWFLFKIIHRAHCSQFRL